MIETERLILKPVSNDDLDIYEQLFTCPETTRYLPGGKPFDLEYINNYVSLKIDHWTKGYGTFIVLAKDDPTIKLGYAGVETVVGTSFNDVRYALLPKFQGKGLAIEATKAVLEYTFNLNKHSEIYGVAVTENTASVSLLQKLGMSEKQGVNLYDSDDLVTMSISSTCIRQS